MELKGKYTNAKITIDGLESSCLDQIREFINNPSFINPVTIMPDAHTGKGSCVGFTMPLHPTRVIPQIIGVDIGCGVLSVNLGQDVPKVGSEKLDNQIRRNIPFGMNTYDMSDRWTVNMEKEFPWEKANKRLRTFRAKWEETFQTKFPFTEYNMQWYLNKCKELGAIEQRIVNSLGTLGGGNHFIEFGRSEKSNDIWLTVHSGSRSLGKLTCEYWQRKTQNPIREMMSKELYYLENEDMFGYLTDMIFAQEYASFNRKRMSDNIIQLIYGTKVVPKEVIESTHNFIDFDDWIIRKGGIRSYTGEKMVIPFNMRDGILICEGKSNPEWNYSAPHGAGRVLSRTKAKAEIKLEDFQKSMEGIYSTSVNQQTIDESPMAYKDSQMIEKALEGTATVIDKIKPIHNLKA